jgi:hypothetical protein
LIKQEVLVTLRFQMLELEKEKQQEAQELQFAEMKREVAFLHDEKRNLQYVLYSAFVVILLSVEVMYH